MTKKTKKTVIAKKTKEPLKTKKEKYFEGVGRRKTAVARVRLFSRKEGGSSKRTSSSSLPSLSLRESSVVNEKPLEEYFPTIELQQAVYAPLNLMDCLEQFKVSVKVKGGGTVSQAEAVRHGVARALVLFNPDFRKKLKKAGYLKRDPRMRERKKFGLKRARRAPQWSKR
ncbi:MAG: 30S ribosomal protein S9 [Candidatus Nealsonbacteria bacterium]|nr:30S ribosomal protein S9 [Candidatus Nealsonbacteria bacterium]